MIYNEKVLEEHSKTCCREEKDAGYCAWFDIGALLEARGIKQKRCKKHGLWMWPQRSFKAESRRYYLG